MKDLKENYKGIIFSFIIALISTGLGKKLPIIGGAVFGIVIGVIINNTIGKPDSTKKGIAFVSKKVLQWSIVLLGAGLSFNQVKETGMESLSVTVVTISVAFLSAFLIGKFLNVPSHLKSLIGVGTAICGGSAIAAISPIIEADEQDIAYSISTIFFFNIIAVLIFPPLGHLLNLTDKGFGLWAGTAINDTSSVVAAGYVFSNAAGEFATIVKLTRATLIIPIALIFALITAYRKKQESNFRLKKIFPWFILWFLIASILNTVGIIPKVSIPYINEVGKFMIVMALSAIGLSANFKDMIKSGVKPIFLGLIVWFNVAVSSLIVQHFMKQL
ncbi:YeiH family protein [Clostridium rectalis]|uniref:YeiH family protein n=1 Tax=Clostridium rectalis TaxID=2040295 RepID=UPI000F63973D|nr:YeiH family protein [Clostridium rectalis]